MKTVIYLAYLLVALCACVESVCVSNQFGNTCGALSLVKVSIPANQNELRITAKEVARLAKVDTDCMSIFVEVCEVGFGVPKITLVGDVLVLQLSRLYRSPVFVHFQVATDCLRNVL